MLALDARLALLVVICVLSSQWINPHSAVSGAVIARGAGSDESSHSQLPWMDKGRVDTTQYQKRGKYMKKRMADLKPANPVSKIADAIYSVFKNKGHHKRAHKSIIIPDNHGTAYMITHGRREPATPLWRVGDTSDTTPRKRDNSSASATDSDSSSGIPGTVGIMSPVYNSTDGGRMIASLYMTNMNGTYVLNASDTNKTQMYLVPMSSTSRDATSQAASDDGIQVTLSIPDFSGSDGNRMPYCATFDPNPAKPEPMTMEQCFNASTPSTHTSQTFMYNKDTGVVRPMWYSGQDDGTSDNSTTTAQAVSASDGGNNSTMSMASNGTWSSASGAQQSSASASPTMSMAARQDYGAASASSSSSQGAQNVTLVFIPANRQAAVAAAVDSTNTTSISASQNARLAPSSAATMTTTQTVTVFATASSMSGSDAFRSRWRTRTATPSASASTPSSSDTAGGLDVELVGDGSLPASATSSASLSASSSPLASSTGVAQAADVSSAFASSSSGMIAQAAAVTTSSVSSSSSSSTMIAQAADAASSSSSASYTRPTASVDAAAIASNIAASASASSSSALAASSTISPSATASAASVDDGSSSSASDSAASADPSSATLVAAVVQRNAAPVMTPVNTEPYKWKFKAESR